MFWQETRPDDAAPSVDDVTDVAYQIRCQTLPVDHAWALSEAVRAAQEYTWNSLVHGFRPGMGQFVPQRLWRSVAAPTGSSAPEYAHACTA